MTLLKSPRKLAARLLGFLLLGGSPGAFAVEEIGEPAGELPEASDLPEVSPTEEAAQKIIDDDDLVAPKAKKKKGSGKAKKPPADEKPAETWDSYSEAGTGGVAQEITKGVRVEDIVEPPSDYRYAAFGKPDPFVPPMITSDKPVGPGNLEIPIVSPLQRYEVGTLQLVGVWQLASGERKAMVLTPDSEGGSSQGIVVKNGDPIGNRGGKILAIGDDFLTVREFSLALDGTRQYEDQQMYMGTRNANEQPGKIIFKPGDPRTQTVIQGQAPAAAAGDAPIGGDGKPLENKAPAPGAGPGTGPGAAKSGKAPGTGNGDLGGGNKPPNGASNVQGAAASAPAPAPKASTSAYNPIKSESKTLAPAPPNAKGYAAPSATTQPNVPPTAPATPATQKF